MTNKEIYDQAFLNTLGVKKEQLPGLKYRKIKQWDSVGHMDLVSELEEKFDIQMETIDVLRFNSYEMGKEVLGNYGIDID